MELPNSQKGIAHPFLLLFVIIAAIVAVVLINQGLLKIPPLIKIQTSKEPKVELKTDYKNPFDKTTQYVNPFAGYKNPFDTLR